MTFVGRTVNVAARVQTLTRIHQADILVTEALRAELDGRFVFMPMGAEFVKGIAEPVVIYAVREGPSPAGHRLDVSGPADSFRRFENSRNVEMSLWFFSSELTHELAHAHTWKWAHIAASCLIAFS